jgi:LAO/AO transport system kinase
LRPRLTLNEYYEGVTTADPVVLAQSITLIESTLPSDQEVSDELLSRILPHTENSIRIGITGVPGVGKSTFIESFGKHITSQNKRIAVLTIDPSSQVTKGSILGDKTRMEELSKNKLAFIRPSAAGRTTGGVAYRTREAILLCEAAGFDIILVETVGVGQSEIAVKNMVDFFLLLMLPGAGDELQGLKKGIIEMADALVITKADGENINKAKEAQANYQQALHLLPHSPLTDHPKVLICSAITNDGIREIWEMITGQIQASKDEGHHQENRKRQTIAWLQDNFNELIANEIDVHDTIRITASELEKKVTNNEMPVRKAARNLLIRYHEIIRQSTPETNKKK